MTGRGQKLGPIALDIGSTRVRMLLLEALICLQKGQRGKTVALADAAMQADPSCATAARELRQRAGDIDATMPSIVFFSSERNDGPRIDTDGANASEEVRRR